MFPPCTPPPFLLTPCAGGNRRNKRSSPTPINSHTPIASSHERHPSQLPALLKTPSAHQACTLCDQSIHATPYGSMLLKLRHLLDTPPLPTIGPTHIPGQPKMHAKHACTICAEYGHYTHHCPKLPRYRRILFSSQYAHAPPTPNDEDTLNESIYYLSITPGNTSG